MVHGLAAFHAGIHNDAVTVVKVLGPGDLCRRPKQVTEQGLIALTGIDNGTDVPAGDNENVHRRLGVKVGEGVAKLILVNGGGGNGTFNDLAEQAAHSETSVHGRCCIEEDPSSNVCGTRICRCYCRRRTAGQVFYRTKQRDWMID